MLLKIILPSPLILLLQTYCSALNVVAPYQPDIAVTVHNSYRRSQNSSNMKALHWDRELADAASNHAIKCDYNFDPNNLEGENVYVTNDTYTTDILERAITSWYNQKDDYDFSINICFKVCRSFLQVVWANSYRIGCAVASCSAITNAFQDDLGGTLVICRYSTKGNAVDLPMRKGARCSECDSDWYCDDGLCVPEAPTAKPDSGAELASTTLEVTSTDADPSDFIIVTSTTKTETYPELPPTTVRVTSAISKSPWVTPTGAETTTATAFMPPLPRPTEAESSRADTTTTAGETTPESSTSSDFAPHRGCSEEYARILRDYTSLMEDYKKEFYNWKEMTSTNLCFQKD